MYKVKLVLVSFLLAVIVSAQEIRPFYYPPHRGVYGPIQNYDFQVVRSHEVPAAAVAVKPLATSILDYIPDPLTAIRKIGSTAVSAVSLLLSRMGWISLGSGLVVAFCAFTPFCSMTVEAPLVNEFKVLTHNVPYIDNVEHILSNAYRKYHEFVKK